MQNAIEIRGLTKYYRGKFFKLSPNASLYELNLKIPKGSVFGFLGHNGAGKTTTIKCLMGLIKATSGEATVFGVSSNDKSVREKIGYLPDSPSFSDHLSPKQFLGTCAKLVKIPWKDRSQRVEEVLDAVQMVSHAGSSMGSFSRGMMQRIGIAQALLNNPEILILDEPLVGLDPQGRRDLLSIVRKQQKLGTTVFFCSHILSDVEKLCDSVGILSKGKLVFAGSIDELTDSNGAVLTFPKEHIDLAKTLMIDADGSSKLEDGSIHLEFNAGPIYDKVSKMDLPAGVMTEPRRGSLEKEFFKLTGDDTPGGE